jgi:PAS domain S-box-containing protein
MTKRILIVDDNQENRYLLRALFEGHGYDVVEASEGNEALEKSREHIPHAVVTDLLMPGMDGFSFCREWTRDDALRRVPLIVYTATYTDPKDRQLALDLGAASFIIKPTEPEELLQVVVSAIHDAEKTPPPRPSISTSDFYERYTRRLKEKLDRKLGQLTAADRSLTDYVTRCEAILDTTSNAIVSLNSDCRIRTWSFRAEELFDYTEEEILNRSYKILVPADRLLEAEEKLRTARDEKGVIRFETQWLNKSKELVDVEMALSYLGPEIGYVAAISDLTATRRAVEEKKQLEEQLAIAQRLESVGRLASGVAHDFNNLLTVILFHAKSIETDPRHGGLFRRAAKNILEAGERAAALTQQLLTFGRRQTIKSMVIDLNDTVRGMGTILRRIIGEDIDLRIELATALDPIEWDVSQMEQVILNLVVNARDAMPDGGRLVIRTDNRVLDEDEAAMHPSLKPGCYVMLSITDNGEGMDKETCSHIFEPFFTTKPHGKGTGLGLATVYGIVEQSKGVISVYSEPGTGTTFKVFLPRVDLSPTCRTPQPAITDTRGRGETILVVEDEEMVRQIARQILERAGYIVLEASGAEHALALAAETSKPIHLLLTDVIMPKMNGRDLAASMLATRPSMKVVFTSGYANDTIARHGILDPQVSLVEKPFSDRSLTVTIRAVLEGREPGGIGNTR